MAENNQEDKKIDENLKEIMKKASNNPSMSEAEAKELILKINKEFDFDKILEYLKQKYPLGNDKYVIFTNSNEQLYYENGEFFLIAATDISKQKKKITRMQALELYNQYYITNVLNPLLKQKNKVKEKVESVKIVPESVIEVESVEKQEKTVEAKEKEIKEKNKEELEQKQKVNANMGKVQIEDRLKELKAKEQEIKKRREDKVR